MILQKSTSPEQEYKLLRTSAVLSTPGAGFLHLHGSESIDFLNRLSTNDLKNLQASQVRATLLTTEKARMIDLVRAVHLGDRIMLIVSDGRAAAVKSWLEKYIIMEDITVTDVTESYQRISIIGPEAPSIASQLCGRDLSKPGDSIFTVLDASGSFLFRNQEWPHEVYDIVGNRDELEQVAARVRSIGRMEAGAPDAILEAINSLRVELGVPEGGKEIDDRVNPLEAGLVRFVSFTKGCYIGQEVIARLDTYKKLQRRLMGFVFPAGYEDATTGDLLVDGVEVGWTTSHAHSYKVGKQIALGYLKLFPDSNRVTFAGKGAKQELSVEVVDLPFVFSELSPLVSV